MSDYPHRITRYEKIYPSKVEALKTIGNNQRPYGELVSIRYTGDSGTTQVLVVFYKDLGYETLLDSEKKETSRVFEVTRRDGENDLGCIRRAVIGEAGLLDRDLVIVHTRGLRDIVYMYYQGSWVALTKNSKVEAESSETLNLTVTRDESRDSFIVQGDVRIDDESLVLGESGKIEIGHIDCGLLRNL